MRVILLQRVARLGQVGEVVSVKDGYARNFLLPKGKALKYSSTSITEIDEAKVLLTARTLDKKDEALHVAARLQGQEYWVIRSASDSGVLYGSVTTRDVAEAISADGFLMDRRQFEIHDPIRELGLHEVTVKLHPEVETTIILNVARSPEEAKLQSAKNPAEQLVLGDDIQILAEGIGLPDAVGAYTMHLHKDMSEFDISDNSTIFISLAFNEELKLEETVSDFISGLSDGKKLQISATSMFLADALAEIEDRKSRIEELLNTGGET
jgi:large subunit ribosomal protein L9